MSRDPVNLEIGRLRAPLSMPQRSITVDGQKVPLDPQQYDELVQLSGQPAKKALAQTLSSAEWKAMTDEDRREFVKETLEDFRASARDELLKRHPELVPAGQSAPRLPPQAMQGADPWAEFQPVEQAGRR
jgi:hypothetical protein